MTFCKMVYNSAVMEFCPLPLEQRIKLPRLDSLSKFRLSGFALPFSMKAVVSPRIGREGVVTLGKVVTKNCVHCLTFL